MVAGVGGLFAVLVELKGMSWLWDSRIWQLWKGGGDR